MIPQSVLTRATRSLGPRDAKKGQHPHKEHERDCPGEQRWIIRDQPHVYREGNRRKSEQRHRDQDHQDYRTSALRKFRPKCTQNANDQQRKDNYVRHDK